MPVNQRCGIGGVPVNQRCIFLFWLDSETILIDDWLWYLGKVVMAAGGDEKHQINYLLI